MTLLDNAISHFGESADTTLHKIDVSEWDGEIWFKVVSSMNGVQYQKFLQAAQKADFEALVDILILRARQQDGLKLFTTADKKKLMGQVSPDVVTSIVNSMSSVDNAEAEAVKKS